MPETSLDELIDRLERLAAELRGSGLDAEHAASLVEECASVAAQAGAELDRRVRAGEAPAGPPGQLPLGS